MKFIGQIRSQVEAVIDDVHLVNGKHRVAAFAGLAWNIAMRIDGDQFGIGLIVLPGDQHSFFGAVWPGAPGFDPEVIQPDIE